MNWNEELCLLHRTTVTRDASVVSRFSSCRCHSCPDTGVSRKLFVGVLARVPLYLSLYTSNIEDWRKTCRRNLLPSGTVFTGYYRYQTSARYRRVKWKRHSRLDGTVRKQGMILVHTTPSTKRFQGKLADLIRQPNHDFIKRS